MRYTLGDMAQTQVQPVETPTTAKPTPAEVICQLRETITGGLPWQEALLAAVGRWPLASEELDGVRYQYLLLGEAFDWLALAGRLLEDIADLVPAENAEALLFADVLPSNITDQRFQELIGPEKYRAHLNYFYGVLVEETLLLAGEEEIRKGRASIGLPEPPDVTDLACQRIYGASQQELLDAFFAETGRPVSDRLSLLGLKEFTYWLFKRRLASVDSVKVASDTKKGLERLARMVGGTI